MKHPIITDIERYIRKDMGIFSRILIAIHLERCKECSILLESLREDDRLLGKLTEAVIKQRDEDIKESDKTFLFLKNILDRKDIR